MALIDDVRIKIKAGKGGNGANVFRTVVNSPKRYSDGGNGGDGGNIYFQASNNVADLNQFRFQKEVKAQDGANGMNNNKTGKNGKDTLVLVPPGTKIINERTREENEILEQDLPVLVAKGGRGGEGNANYKPDIKRFRPQNTEGGQGEEKDLHLILRLIADAGLIGFPNAGKSSLLDALTRAHPKIGAYPFTTLEPNLGAMGKIIIADIPGLIEGASRGTGLGIEFLRHIEKTKILIHCIDSTAEDPVRAYKTIRKEFSEYSLDLLEKDEIIILTKTDLAGKEDLHRKMGTLKSLNRVILPVSIYDKESLKSLKTAIEDKIYNVSGDFH